MLEEQVLETANSWRDRWIIKNVFAEIPIVGIWFKTSNKKHICYMASKELCMLTGSTTFMMLNVMGMKETDSDFKKGTEMATGMAIGMMAGAVVFNASFYAVKKIDSVIKCNKKLLVNGASENGERSMVM